MVIVPVYVLFVSEAALAVTVRNMGLPETTEE